MELLWMWLLWSTTYIVTLVECQYEESMCMSLQYRSLPIALQNEHRCMILETIQRDLENGNNERHAILDDIIRYKHIVMVQIKHTILNDLENLKVTYSTSGHTEQP